MNKAEWAGYATPDQYIQYLQKQAAAWKDLNGAMLERVGIYKENTQAALDYYNAISGAHKTIGMIGTSDNLGGITALNDALDGLPDQVDTQVTVSGLSEAMTAIATYKAELDSIPQTV